MLFNKIGLEMFKAIGLEFVSNSNADFPRRVTKDGSNLCQSMTRDFSERFSEDQMKQARQDARFSVLLEVMDEKINDQTADLKKRMDRIERLVITALLFTIVQLVGLVAALVPLKLK